MVGLLPGDRRTAERLSTIVSLICWGASISPRWDDQGSLVPGGAWLPWDPRAVSDPRLVAEGSDPQRDPFARVGYYLTSEDKRMARVKRAWETWRRYRRRAPRANPGSAPCLGLRGGLRDGPTASCG